MTAMYLYGSAGNAIAVEDFTREEVEAYTYVKDAQGSTCLLTDESGEAVTNYEYDDYGVTNVTGTATVNVLAYTGGVYDEETGQYYLNARYYDPEQGVFLTQDTYRGEQNQPATWNLYGYCGGNPVNYVDPSGHDAIWLQYAHAAYNMGHTGLAIQEKNKKWNYFFWGPKNENAKILIGAPVRLVYKRIPSILSALQLRPKILINALNRLTKNDNYYKETLTDIMYFRGDFTESHKYIRGLLKQQSRNTLQSYNLFINNCLQVSLRALVKGKFADNERNLKGTAVNQIKRSRYMIPNNAFKKLQNLTMQRW